MSVAGVFIVVPAYNEGGAIGEVLDGLAVGGYEVIVVDDGSTDATAALARERGAIVCRHLVNLGQGAALQTGIECALALGARVVVTFDADGQHRPEDVSLLLSTLAGGSFDVVLGSRFLAGSGRAEIPFARRLVLRAAVVGSHLTTGLRLTDVHNGLRALTRDAATRIRITQNRMSHASQLLQQIRDLGLRYKEVPVRVLYTEYSVRKGQRITNALNILWEIVAGGLRKK